MIHLKIQFLEKHSNNSWVKGGKATIMDYLKTTNNENTIC